MKQAQRKASTAESAAHPDQAALGIQPGHLQLFHMKHSHFSAQGGHLFGGCFAFECKPDAARGQRFGRAVHKIGQRGKGARTHQVVGRVQLFDALVQAAQVAAKAVTSWSAVPVAQRAAMLLMHSVTQVQARMATSAVMSAAQTRRRSSASTKTASRSRMQCATVSWSKFAKRTANRARIAPST